MKGKTHEIVNIIFLPPLVYISPEEARVSIAVGYIVGTFFLSPDIDIHYSRSSKRWGLLRIIWFPLWMLTKHRGILHKPLVGTVIKLSYILSVFLLLFYIIEGLFGINMKISEITISAEQILYFLVGITLADLLHILCDYIYTKLKRLI